MPRNHAARRLLLMLSMLMVLCLPLAALAQPAATPATPATPPAAAPDQDLSTSMREWLDLSDAQVQQLKPVIDSRVTKANAALDKLDASDDPDIQAFLAETKANRDEFNASLAKILSPDQLKKWATFKADVEKELAQQSAENQLLALQPQLGLTDAQTVALVPAMTTATAGKMDVLQKLANTGRISLIDKKKAANAMKDINGTLQKAMTPVLTPDQMTAYLKIQADKKAAIKAAMKK